MEARDSIVYIYLYLYMYIIAHATVFEELKGAKRRTWKLQQLFHTTFQRKLGFEFLRLSSKIYIYILCVSSMQ